MNRKFNKYYFIKPIWKTNEKLQIGKFSDFILFSAQVKTNPIFCIYGI